MHQTRSSPIAVAQTSVAVRILQQYEFACSTPTFMAQTGLTQLLQYIIRHGSSVQDSTLHAGLERNKTRQDSRPCCSISIYQSINQSINQFIPVKLHLHKAAPT
jgi:hypothetical protein